MKKIRIFLSFLLLFLFVAACQSQNEEENQTGIEGQGFSREKIEDVDPNEIANHLAKLCTEVPDVENATAIVIGPYALVGIDVNGDIDQSEVGSIKYQVAEALANDPYGAKAAVTADPDIMNRIKDMREEMANGKPIQAIMDELAAIIGRVIPIVPGEEHRKAKEPTEMNNDRMNESEEKELKQIQDEQGKGIMNDRNKEEE